MQRITANATAAGFALLLCACKEETPGDPFERVADFPETASSSAVWTFGPDDVWVAADTGQMLHYDGEQWATTLLPGGETMLDIWGFAPNDIWAAGGKTVAHYDGADWALTDLSLIDFDIQSLAAIWGSSGTDIWVAGNDSITVHFDGATWTQFPGGSSENTALWGLGPDDVYTGGVFEAAHWDGTQWSPVDTLAHGVTDIFGFAADDYWMVEGERLSHWNGVFWDIEDVDGLSGIDALWGSASDDLWGVGDSATVLHWDGNDWREQQSQTAGSGLVDVHGSSSTDIWALSLPNSDGTPPELYRYTGG